MSKTDFIAGDKVFHKSDYSVIWVIERIEENEAFCSTLLKDSKKLTKEKFSLSSIEKMDTTSSTIIIGSRKRNNNYY